jgi:hypothetical protein
MYNVSGFFTNFLSPYKSYLLIDHDKSYLPIVYLLFKYLFLSKYLSMIIRAICSFYIQYLKYFILTQYLPLMTRVTCPFCIQYLHSYFYPSIHRPWFLM